MPYKPNASFSRRKKGRTFLLRKKCDAFYGQLDAIVGRSRYRGE
jgi:hypothetical protein